MTPNLAPLPAPEQRAVWTAMAACFAMIAYHAGSKAVRDAFFLTQFDLSSLPAMVAVAALVSIGAVLGSAGAISRFTPALAVPTAFALSAALHMAIWWVADVYPRAAAVAVYLASIALGSILTSGFWSVFNERFDPLSAKAAVGRVAGAGTLGGLLSGVVAARLASSASLTAALPVLAAYHLAAGVLVYAMGSGIKHVPRPSGDEARASGIEVLRHTPYLRTLAAIVILGTISAAMLDYVFKAAALAEYGKGERLLRFFAIFHTAASGLTFLVQTLLSRTLLASLGTARTVATLPLAASAGGAAALLLGGLWPTTIARGVEYVFRGSLFRAGYEVFYMPMPLHEKRAAKAVIDVSFDRLGDALGSVFVSLLIALGVTVLPPAVLTAAVLVALAGVYVASRLDDAYVDALEHGLRDRTADAVAAANAEESMGVSMLGASLTMMPALSLREFGNGGDAAAYSMTTFPGSYSTTQFPGMGPVTAPTAHTFTQLPQDAITRLVMQLRAGERGALRQAAADLPEHPELAAHVIPLIGRDDLSQAAMRALQPVVARHAGQLLDTLLDDKTDFAIRRRLPRLLAGSPQQSVANGLLHGLNDRRFEVRFQCGRALVTIAERNRLLRLVPDEIFGHIQKEVAVSKPVWESHLLLDAQEDAEASPLFDDYLRNRTSRGLQHIFTLLSLVLPPEPLKLAFNALHSGDGHLRATALEYLSSVLPRDIRDRLWPLIVDTPAADAIELPADRERALRELMRADQTIYLRISELRKQGGSSGGPPATA